MHFRLPAPAIHRQTLTPPYRTLANVIIVFSLLLTVGTITVMAQQDTGLNNACPNEEPILVSVPKNEYRPISGISRPGTCVKPDMVFMHATAGGNLESNWELFNNGGYQQNGTNAHFIIGTDGAMLQTVPLYEDMAELAHTNTPMNYRSIGIELVNPDIDFDGGKSGMKPEQYSAALSLVCFLMDQYSIPLGTNEWDWVNEPSFWRDNPEWSAGVYGHYQIGTTAHQDPGKEWMRDFREDLRAQKCSVSGVNTGGSGGRVTPYDAYARPYSWPVNGTIRQDYGFTEQAQILGARFPTYYPKGDPSAIFSTTNHDEIPVDPGTTKFINPNIDIAPDGGSSQARAVYATHAGWITFADWAGPEKGYTIQVESDIEGDGQADFGTRYMRLQAPEDGFFAPDVPVTRLIVSGSSSGMSGTCTDPTDPDWANVNQWNDQIKRAIAEIQRVEEVEVPCNLVKAFMKLESNGEELPPNVDGYGGLMQVGNSSATGGGSNCDWQTYDISTTEGNLNCGVQEIARGYIQCENSWDGAILKYFSGRCYDSGDADSFGTTTGQYLQIVNDNWEYLESQATGPTTVDTLPEPNPTTENPEKTDVITDPPYVLEAENMEIQNEDESEIVYDDSSASGGASVRLDGTSTIYETVFAKADQLMIRAKSVKNIACVNQQEARLEVMVDGSVIEAVEVKGSVFTTYPVSVEGLNGRDHILSLRLVNPGALICDRSLWVDSIHYIVTNPNTPTVETVSSTLIEAESLADATEGDKQAETQDNAREDKLASDGRYVAFTSNSKIEGEVEIPESNYFTIRARADICGEGHGVPIIRVSIDDVEVTTLGVDSEYWTEYSYKYGPGETVPGTSSGSTTPPTSDDSTNTDQDIPSQFDDDSTIPGPRVEGAMDHGGKVLQSTDQIDAEDETEPSLHKLTIEFTNDEFIAGVCDRNVYVDVLSFKKFEVTQAVYSKMSLIGKTKYVAYNQLIGYVSSSRGTDEEWEEFVNDPENEFEVEEERVEEQLEELKQEFYQRVPNANQTYLSYRIMFNNPNFTTFPLPIESDRFINAVVDNPYIVETSDNTVAGSLKTVFDEPDSPMFFFCALRQQGDNVRCITEPNP